MIEVIQDQLAQKEAYLAENPGCEKTREQIAVLVTALHDLDMIEAEYEV